MTSIVECAYGGQTFSGTSAKISTFALLPGERKRTFPSKVMTEAGRSMHAASTDGHKLHGYWHTARYESVEGMLLMIQVMNTVMGARRNNAAMLISLRESAESLLVQARISPHRDAVFSTISAFVGRGDILSPAEATELGYVLDTGYINTFFDMEEIEEVFDVSVLAAGTADRPEVIEVATGGGEKIKVLASPKPKRKVVVRRKSR